jgi:hypothetical protein
MSSLALVGLLIFALCQVWSIVVITRLSNILDRGYLDRVDGRIVDSLRRLAFSGDQAQETAWLGLQFLFGLEFLRLRSSECNRWAFSAIAAIAVAGVDGIFMIALMILPH